MGHRQVTDLLIIAADLSITSTGLAAGVFADGQMVQVGVRTVGTEPRNRRGDPIPMPARHEVVVGAVFGPLDARRGVDRLVVKEKRLAAAAGRQPGSAETAQDLAGLHAVLEYGLWRRGVPHVDVPGPTLKKFATGRHQAAKEDVRVAAAKRLEHLAECTDNNQSDALWLLVMAAGMYGLDVKVVLPVVQQAAGDKLAWPTVGRHYPKGSADASR